jgi:hypothetical protein
MAIYSYFSPEKNGPINLRTSPPNYPLITHRGPQSIYLSSPPLSPPRRHSPAHRAARHLPTAPPLPGQDMHLHLDQVLRRIPCRSVAGNHCRAALISDGRRSSHERWLVGSVEPPRGGLPAVVRGYRSWLARWPTHLWKISFI